MDTSRPNKKIFNYACWLLAKRRYSVSDFAQKLRKKFPDQKEERDEVTELFIARKYLDDAEYARLFVRDQLARKPQGLRLMKQKLSRKGIRDADISRIMEDEKLDELTLALEAATKKLKTLKTAQGKTGSGKTNLALGQQQKLYLFLASRGFSPDVTMKTLKKLGGAAAEGNGLDA
jgi:regulatory protein